MRIAKSITELRKQIHDDLRIQHPEWVLPNGECPECDEHEARLMKLLYALMPKAATSPSLLPSAV
jgi:hypothetical protein